jgi:hypothetical protein
MLHDFNEFPIWINDFEQKEPNNPDAPATGYRHWAKTCFNDSGTSIIMWQNQPPFLIYE